VRGNKVEHTALYRKYRSKRLDEIVGQSHVTNVLSRALKDGRVAHAYLLTGLRGIGKTSIARILAHEINGFAYKDGTSHLDIIEIDAASNNGVEDVRDLREKVQITPVSGKYKVYIIDEVHMLSKAAFNALLKTLEEPPRHAVFILATTDVDKLPDTIISRTQRFTLRPISLKDAATHLRAIADNENIIIDEDALQLIAERGEGSFRDSISLLDQLRHITSRDTPITRDLIEQSLGMAKNQLVADITNAYAEKNLTAIVSLLDKSEDEGVQPSVLATQLISYTRTKVTENPIFLPLLDALLDVAKSSNPRIKLLTALAAHAVPKPVKSAALSAPTATISAPVESLQKPKPVTTPSSTPARKAVKAVTPEVEMPKPVGTVGTLDWDAFTAYIKEHSIAVSSVLSKCSYEQRGDTLVLYTGSAFYKKKLDDSRYRVSLAKALIETGAGDMPIEIVGTPPPPKDAAAAAVAEIMGGGEEVNVGDSA